MGAPASTHGGDAAAPTPAPQRYEDRKIAEAQAAGDIAAAERWRRVKADVDKAPLLTPAQKAQLRVLLAPEIAKAQAKNRPAA